MCLLDDVFSDRAFTSDLNLRQSKHLLSWLKAQPGQEQSPLSTLSHHPPHFFTVSGLSHRVAQDLSARIHAEREPNRFHLVHRRHSLGRRCNLKHSSLLRTWVGNRFTTQNTKPTAEVVMVKLTIKKIPTNHEQIQGGRKPLISFVPPPKLGIGPLLGSEWGLRQFGRGPIRRMDLLPLSLPNGPFRLLGIEENMKV